MHNALTHSLLDHDGVSHGFFTRRGGVSNGQYESLNAGEGSDDNPAHVATNRARIAATLGAQKEALLSLHQIHSREVLIVDAPFVSGQKPQADGLVTKSPGLALSALSADCAPVLFLEPNARIIGAAHAGWRGALSGITDAVLDAMESAGATRHNICAVVGPCISQASYEVGPEFQNKLVEENESYERFFTLGPQKPNGERRAHFDLKGFILARLRAAGLVRIDVLPDCTYAQPQDFFSYRYNTHQGIKDYGRNISAILLTE